MAARLPLAFAAALLVFCAGAAAVSAQRGGGIPRITLPDVPQQERDPPNPPRFRSSVTRVEVSVLVLDRDGTPVRGLTAADFEVRENGVPQVVRSFTPFTYEPGLIELPDPVAAGAGASKTAASMPASNYYTSASRVFALVLDDLHVDPRRTQVAREAARRLLDQLAPEDLLFVTTTAAQESTGYFTRDRQYAREIVERFAGQRLLDKTIAGLRFPGLDFEAERLDHYQRLCATIRNVSIGLANITGRRKTVILISEGSSFGAGLSDMMVRMPTATGGGQANVPAGSSSVMNAALAAAAAGNVAIYPLNPAGLDVPDAEIIAAPGLLRGEMTSALYSQILVESRQSKEMARDLAALTGGVSLVDTNEPLAGIDRAVRDASSHYILTYEPQTSPKGSEYRRIDVTVRRPGLRVLARRGYGAPDTKPAPPMKVPSSLSPQLRTLLAGVMPEDGLPMRVQAAPIARKGGMTTVAIVVEVNGTVLGKSGEKSVRVEQGLLTVNGSGKAANGVRRIFDVSLSPVQREVLGATGLRSIWAIDLPAGRHAVRVGSIDLSNGRGGSVYLDVDIPKGPAPGMLIASRLLSVMPTVFADERVTRWTTATPTATRVFLEGDALTVIVAHPEGIATARLLNANGDVVWKGEGTPLAALPASQFVIPLGASCSPVCDLVVRSNGADLRTAIGVVPANAGGDSPTPGATPAAAARSAAEDPPEASAALTDAAGICAARLTQRHARPERHIRPRWVSKKPVGYFSP